MDEPCTWRVSAYDPIADVCPNCGHTMLVHGGHANPRLQECAICTILAAATRLEERRDPVFEMKITKDEQTKMLSQIAHEPVPSESRRCQVCDGVLVWVHEIPQAGDA